MFSHHYNFALIFSWSQKNENVPHTSPLWSTLLHLLYMLPCLPHHKATHQFYSPHQVITYFAGRVFDPNEAERGRVAFAGEYLKGDASLLISDLSLTDSGEYSCKVKTGVQYHWSTISLIVLGKWKTALRFNKKNHRQRADSWECCTTGDWNPKDLSIKAAFCGTLKTLSLWV